MKSLLYLIFVFLSLSAQFFSQNDPKKIAGVYQWCPFHCETIKINQDFTFDYLLDGDLSNNERTNGNWSFAGENKIHLKSPVRKLISQVTEKKTGNNNNISVSITDTFGAVFPGIVIKVNDAGGERQFITNEDGICEIPKTNEIEIFWNQFSEKYHFKNVETNQIIVELPAINEPFVNDVFIFKNKQLFKIDDDGKIFINSYKKLNKKISDKLFPVN